MAAIVEELLFFDANLVGRLDGEGWWFVVCSSDDVGRTDAPSFDDADVYCDADLKDIFGLNFLNGDLVFLDKVKNNNT